MNLVDTTVTEILGEPKFLYNKWFLEVIGNAYGNKQQSSLMFNTKEEADAIKVGHTFLS